MNVSKLIDQFVLVLDPAGNVFGRVESAPWIETLESKLPQRLPASFRSLVTRYTFPPFDVGSLSFFANQGGNSYDELSVAVFKDQFIADTTLKAGYTQFARPPGGSYDPICLTQGVPLATGNFRSCN